MNIYDVIPVWGFFFLVLFFLLIADIFGIIFFSRYLSSDDAAAFWPARFAIFFAALALVFYVLFKRHPDYTDFSKIGYKSCCECDYGKVVDDD